MHQDAQDYRPISCDFHDVLEATATLRRLARIEFMDEAGNRLLRDARIVDLVTRPDGEFMQLSSGESVRLDRIIAVDGTPLP